MSGSNYFISVKQLLESEKKIKLVSYLKHTKVCPHELALEVIDSPETLSNNQMLTNLLHSTCPDDLLENEMHVIAYVAGYIAFKLSLQLRCPVCSAWLSSSSCLPDISEDDSSEAFIRQINRGRLKAPSSLCTYFACTLIAFLLTSRILLSSPPSYSHHCLHPLLALM